MILELENQWPTTVDDWSQVYSVTMVLLAGAFNH